MITRLSLPSSSDLRPFMVCSRVMLVASRNGSKEMLFYLTMLHLARFLWEDPPVVDENDIDTARRAAYDQWGQGDFMCQNDVL
ncbi:hypothetical protein ACS0TY_007292 [Phlomoides rotata]